ncbi:transglycosylase SLT domain-containing protein [Geminisphaera colitermitum]|uniref:transglycosylase SLT domain-containing protein n=1 Tax=Geminisphaera colitermitum TaxID=1148786 RepID=UPI000158D094|nr:transglycosylase SLT domain-containing protein [Geminisphaera colitermitum]
MPYAFRHRLSFFRILPFVLFAFLAGCESLNMQDYELVSADDVADMYQSVRGHFAGEPAPQTTSRQQQAETSTAMHIERTLHEGSLDELAQLRPQAEAVLQEMRRYEWVQPWADWLLARLDYLDLASEALVRARAQEPTRPGAPLPPSPVPPLSAGEVERKARVIVSDRGAWTRRLAGRPAPVRAKTYVDDAKAIFVAEGVPPQWVWLAEVESSWNPEASSPVGARGLFQLMPATAEQLGLSLKPEDERVQPDKNARAAARYLRRLYGRFASWPLTLAAYNAGEGRVSRLLAKQEQPDERTFAAIASALPAETQMYVPRVLATVQLREGVDPLALPAPGQP